MIELVLEIKNSQLKDLIGESKNMKNKEQYKIILKAIKKGSISFKSYSNKTFYLDDICFDKYSIDVNDSVESIKEEIKFYQKQVKKYKKWLSYNGHKLVWNWMNI